MGNMENDILATFLLGLKNETSTRIKIIDTAQFKGWLAKYHHQFGRLNTLLNPKQHVGKNKICDLLEQALGEYPIPQVAYRAYLSLAKTVYDTYYTFPPELQTVYQVSMFVHLYEILLPQKERLIEFELLNGCYVDDVLRYYSDTDLLAIEQQRARQILGMFSFILYLFEGFTLDNFREWNSINMVVTNKITYLQALGRGKYKFGRPVDVWQKEQDAPGFFSTSGNFM